MHINFQSFTLSIFHNKRSYLGQRIKEISRKILMAGTTALIWFTHKKVLKRGGYSFSRFWTEVFMEFQRSKNMIVGDSKISLTPAYLMRNL